MVPTLEDRDWMKYWQSRALHAEDLLRRIAKANVIFPSMCANNMEAYNLNDELKSYLPVPDGRNAAIHHEGSKG